MQRQKPVEFAGRIVHVVSAQIVKHFLPNKSGIRRQESAYRESLAFPLISVDITGMALDDITPQWADLALTRQPHRIAQDGSAGAEIIAFPRAWA